MVLNQSYHLYRLLARQMLRNSFIKFNLSYFSWLIRVVLEVYPHMSICRKATPPKIYISRVDGFTRICRSYATFSLDLAQDVRRLFRPILGEMGWSFCSGQVHTSIPIIPS